MTLIDTHAHLFDKRFDKDLPQVLERARAAGVERILAVGIDRETSVVSLEQARKYPALAASVGIHPNHVGEAAPGDWEEILRLAADPKVIAIGETGLDRHWDKVPFPEQEANFARHIALSRQLQKPLVIHAREAEPDVARMLQVEFEKHGEIRGVLHSYTGEWEPAEACLAMGLYVSFAGMITYPTAGNLRDLVKKIPADRLLVETDCPYLAPVPKRGQRNEPAHVEHTLNCMAAARGESPTELAARTSVNAKRLFGF